MKFFFSPRLYKVSKHTQCVYLVSRFQKLFERLSVYVDDYALRTAVLSAYYGLLHPETTKDIDNVKF